MGILSIYLAHRAGKRHEQRKARIEESFKEELCDNCGHRQEQHADDGSCPTYA